MGRKKPIIKEVENSLNPIKTATESPVEIATPIQNTSALEKEEEDAVPLQAEKPKKVDGRVKKPQTEAQKAATAKMKAALAAKWEKIRAEKEAAAEAHKKEVEEKVVKKALAIKKKQIKKQLALDEISSDEEPMEHIVPKMKKAIARQNEPARQKIIFV